MHCLLPPPLPCSLRNELELEVTALREARIADLERMKQFHTDVSRFAEVCALSLLPSSCSAYSFVLWGANPPIGLFSVTRVKGRGGCSNE